MMLRALCLILLALGCHTAVAADADPAVDDTTLSAASDSGNADREESTASSDDSTEDAAGATANASPLDGEGFVPSVQISEDLSVSFPTDI
jgi:hypothetical protein